jgi:polysaccharide pyruvyl transferase CsaB
MVRALLIGNYGVGNLGDEALCEAVQSLAPEVSWTVVSARPTARALPRLPAGLRSFCTTPWWRTLAALRRSDVVVFGGGSLFTDVESWRACWIWWLHVTAARVCGCRILLVFQGIGPLQGSVARWLTASALRQARHVSVRDEPSAVLALALGARDVVQTVDPVLALLPQTSAPQPDGPLVLIPRHNVTPAFLAACHQAAQFGGPVHVVSLQPDDEQEEIVTRALVAAVPGATCVPVRTLQELVAAIMPARQVVTQRFHGALAALALDKPLVIVPQGGGDKLSNLRDIAEGRVPRTTLYDRLEMGRLAFRQALGLRDSPSR